MARKSMVSGSHAVGSRKQRRAAAARARKGLTPVATTGAALALGLGFSASDAHAASFEVSTLADAGAGSLRQAILDANAAAGADSITFQSGLTGTITLATGPLAISEAVDIQGPGPDALSVSGNDISGVIQISGMSTAVTISGLKITHGAATSGAGITAGNSNLTLDDVEISDNAATSRGAGVDAQTFSLLIIRNSLIANNAESVSSGGGGGLYVQGGLTLQDSRVIGNSARAGAGIYLTRSRAPVAIERTTIADNVAPNDGGGLFIRDPVQGLVIRQSTISGNAAGRGGGMWVYLYESDMRVENSTISDNQAQYIGGGGFYVDLYSNRRTFTIANSTIAGNSAVTSGGGISVHDYKIALENTIIADNTSGSDPDVATISSGSIVANYSLIEDAGGATISGANNILSMDPELGPLGMNGGVTATHLASSTSPATNAGDPAATMPAEDQRGSPRISAGRIDIGAVERDSGTLQCAMADFTASEADGTVNIIVTRTGGTEGAVSVAYASMNGTAMEPGDFAAASGTLQWSDGENADKMIAVALVSDGVAEAAETFTVQLSNPTGTTLGTQATATVTITDPVIGVPTISPIADQTIAEDGTAGPLAFTIDDPNTAVGSLTVTAASSNDALVPDANVVIGGSDAARTVQIMPLGNKHGTTEVTLTVSDGSMSATETFTVTVTPVYDPAAISAIADQSVDEGKSTDVIPFTITDPDGVAGSFVITGTSSNQMLVPNASIELGGSGTSRTVKVTPVADENGTAEITISVDDGTGTTSATFKLSVTAVDKPDSGTEPDAGAPDSGTEPDASQPTGDASMPESDAGAGEKPSADDCSCRVVGQSKQPSGSLTTSLLAVVGFAAWRKKRRAKRDARA